jgi:hypothetical protein
VRDFLIVCFCSTVVHGPEFGTANYFKKIIAHGAVGGLRSVAQGGKFEHGLLAGAFTATFAPGINYIKGLGYRVAAAAMVGGAAAELGGGKFANGAITGAFSRLFNEEIKGRQDQNKQVNLQGDPWSLTEEGGVWKFMRIQGPFSEEYADKLNRGIGKWVANTGLAIFGFAVTKSVAVGLTILTSGVGLVDALSKPVYPGDIRVNIVTLRGEGGWTDSGIRVVENQTRFYRPSDPEYEYYRGFLD